MRRTALRLRFGRSSLEMVRRTISSPLATAPHPLDLLARYAVAALTSQQAVGGAISPEGARNFSSAARTASTILAREV
jgi:hypothetical protein